MLGMQKFVGRRRASALLSVGVAYALAIQALLASVGLGMSAAASEQDGLALCVNAAETQPATPADNAPNSRPQCPFCFVAAQNSFNIAAVAGAPALPAYSGLPIVGRLAVDYGDHGFIPRFRRTVGDPRAPPSSSV